MTALRNSTKAWAALRFLNLPVAPESAAFIAPCLPTKTERPPSGPLWLHEIKHHGFRVIARKDGAKMRLYSQPVVL
jgi:ATP-dependent DNA ligase